jgi:hypothetical protein
MATIDIRGMSAEITRIKFSDNQDVYVGATGVFVEGDVVAARIRKVDVENLIKALQKTVELGWTK